MSASAGPRVGLSLVPGEGFRRAALPLFERGEVEALEWSYEEGLDAIAAEPHLRALLDAYAREDRLSLHGISSSPLGPEPEDFRATIARVRDLAASFRPRRISEHFGFAEARGFRFSAPLPVPLHASAVRSAQERLASLSEASGAPAGLENLAFAFSVRDVLDEGAFLEAILAPLDGFLVLDLHNLHCRAVNFGVDPLALMERYPLGRVRELHVSGGSDSDAAAAHGGGSVRRDTHDGPVPEEVFVLLEIALRRCPSVEDVFLEQLPRALRTGAEQERYREDFGRVRALVNAVQR